MDVGQLLEVANRLKRQTTNRDILVLCEGVIELCLGKPKDAIRFDKKAYQKTYMREYMRKYRAARRSSTPPRSDG